MFICGLTSVWVKHYAGCLTQIVINPPNNALRYVLLHPFYTYVLEKSSNFPELLNAKAKT